MLSETSRLLPAPRRRSLEITLVTFTFGDLDVADDEGGCRGR